MKRFYAALVLSVVLVWGCMWSFSTVNRRVNEIAREAEAGRLESAYEKWKESENVFGALLVHDELDKVERLFARLAAEKNACEPDKAELIAQLKSLPELEKPSIKNIF